MIATRFSLIGILVVVSACGGDNSPSSGNSNGAPTGPTAPQNRAPSISQLTISPTFGVSQLSTFSMQAAATDPDGDSLTFQWDFGDGTTGSGSSVPAKMFGGTGSTLAVRLTVSDGKGGTTSDSRDVTIGSLTGTWIMNIQRFSRLQLDLQQAGGIVSGGFTQLDPLPNTPAGTTGRTDPAEPGKIDKDGQIEIRLKVGPFADFYARGTMDGTGRSVVGTLQGSGFTGTPFTMVKQ